jgi:hypothetical protein
MARTGRPPRIVASECIADGCSSKPRSLGMCGKHYQRHREFGDMNRPSIRDRSDPYEALLACGFTVRDECLISGANVNPGAYRRVSFKNEKYLAHRVSYRKWHGDIPDGYHVDHTCHNEAALRGECDGGECWHRSCVNPGHLRAVPSGVNTAASGLLAERAPWHIRSQRDRCSRDHLYAEGTFILDPRHGGRICILCRRVRDRENKKRKRREARNG